MKHVALAVLLFFLLTAAAYAAVNINTASKEELTTLAGIGPVKAEAIIQRRQEKGPFKNIDELKEVYGIGDKTFARIKNDITVDSSAPAPEVKPAPAAEPAAAPPAPAPANAPPPAAPEVKAAETQPVEQPK
ncbi:MAG: ComEA family DNA-binding protein [Candidatus Electronema sp. V4]|uniref:ComEA family DNA-binding protein n=1 Tax=Candidatus Electronema sp. V4 TaxID=3454756 RepID=UPI0040553E7E